MHVFTTAFRARDLALFVFRKREDDLEGFLAVFAEEFLARHGDLQSKYRWQITPFTPRSTSPARQGRG